MRMRELVEQSGVPRTAIHHYQREGLLPPARKTAPNAAVYEAEHVERLKLIRSLRRPELGPLSLDGIREVLAMVDRGIEPEVAATLLSLPHGLRKTAGGSTGKRERSLSDVAREAGISLSTARELHASGLLVGRSGSGDSRVFDEADVAAGRLIGELVSHDGVHASDLDPIAELVGELVRYERALARLVTARLGPDEGLEGRSSIYRSLHALRTYLFSRLVPEPGGPQ
jgi:DNA-binding transcriptional MerR regulator